MALFGSRSRDEDQDEETAGEPPRRSFVPASALPPERNRLGIFDSEDDDDQADVEFLTAVAREAERAAAATPRDTHGAPNRTASVRMDDERMKVFTDLAPVAERNPVMRTVRLPDVELADLLEELATTSAALRLRRAA
jgi:hypothetical protein